MDKPSDQLFNQSFEKGLAVISAFNQAGRAMSLQDIADASDISKSSAQRMIHTLESLGYVRKHAQTRRYELTPKVMRLGFGYLACDPLVEAATPFLSELARLSGETCNLTEPDGLEMIYVARFVSAQRVPIHMPIGATIPMYCTGSGRAYLSALPEAQARQLLQQSDRRAHTHHTITDLDAILEQVALAQRRGYATNKEELFRGDMSIAVPVIGSRGRPLGAVHAVAPCSRWTLEQAEERLAPLVLDCARAIGNSIRSFD